MILFTLERAVISLARHDRGRCVSRLWLMRVTAVADTCHGRGKTTIIHWDRKSFTPNSEGTQNQYYQDNLFHNNRNTDSDFAE